MQTSEGIRKRYTFSGAVLFEHMKEKEIYTADIAAIKQRVAQAGMENIFAK